MDKLTILNQVQGLIIGDTALPVNGTFRLNPNSQLLKYSFLIKM